MTNPKQNEILAKIKNLENKLWDAISYISSDFCEQCSYMYEQVAKYKEEIKKLKEDLNNECN